MLFNQVLVLVTMLATTSVLAAPSSYENTEVHVRDLPKYPHCGWGHKYDYNKKKCHVERCPHGKAYWDQEKKCKDKPKCSYGYYWDEDECDCKPRKCDKPDYKWDDIQQKCRKPHRDHGKKCEKDEEYDYEKKKCKERHEKCRPYMYWDDECHACVAYPGHSYRSDD